jgi:hypothetical protein
MPLRLPKNLIWTDLESKQGLRGDRLVINRLSHGTAITEVNLNLKTFNPDRAVNTLRLCYTNQSVNAVQGDNRQLWSDQHNRYKCALWTEYSSVC